jgi:hypothetical protein
MAIQQRPAGAVLRPIDELLELPSIHQLLHPPGQRTAAHAVADIDRNTARYRFVRDWMAERWRPEYPVHVGHADVVLTSYSHMDQRVLALPEELDSKWFGNGHRRLAMAVELGWAHILTTSDVFCSADDGEPLRGRTPIVFPVTKEEAMAFYPAARYLRPKWIEWATTQFEAAGLGHLISGKRREAP